MTIPIKELLDCPEYIPTVVNWIQAEWPKEGIVGTEKAITLKLVGGRNRNELPQALIALDNSLPVGYASLIHLELAEEINQKYWIDGLFVIPSYRRAGLGSQLLQKAIWKASQLNLDHLSAYTSSVSLYLKNGWSPTSTARQSADEPIVMRQDFVNAVD